MKLKNNPTPLPDKLTIVVYVDNEKLYQHACAFGIIPPWHVVIHASDIPAYCAKLEMDRHKVLHHLLRGMVNTFRQYSLVYVGTNFEFMSNSLKYYPSFIYLYPDCEVYKNNTPYTKMSDGSWMDLSILS